MSEFDTPSPGAAAPRPTTRLVLDPAERRVIGTLIEKGLTNPQYYPMTGNLLTSGCNQKNNREPLTYYSDDEVEAICRRLQERGLVAHLFPSSGRVGRWRQELGRVYGLNAVEQSILGELLLRGPQTEGELRQRASRMRDIPSLEELDKVLAKLMSGPPAYVIRLTPPGISRGVRYTHNCYPDDELARVLEAEKSGEHAAPVAHRESSRAPEPSVVAELLARIEALEQRVNALESRSS